MKVLSNSKKRLPLRVASSFYNRCNRRKVTIFTCDYDSRMEILTQLHRRKLSIEQITRLNDFNIICKHGADEGKLLDFLEYHDKMRRSDF